MSLMLWSAPVHRGSGEKSSGPRFGIGFPALALVLLLAGCASPVHFPSASPSQPVRVSGALYRPDGSGPFPAVVLLHTCAGVKPHVVNWAQWLKAEGYVALVVDSFSPRGVGSICGTFAVSVQDVAWDGYGALAYLRSLPFVDKDRIGVMGWSYGAMAALLAATEWFASSAQPRPGRFRAAVAFYPNCSYHGHDTTIPVLLLLGEADTWTPSARCVDVAQQLQQRGRTVLWVAYPGALHGFDQAEVPTGTVGGLEYDPVATADAKERIRAFLAQYLRGTPS